MNIKCLTLVISAVISFSANAADVSQAQEAVSHAERNYSSALASYNSEAYQSGSGVRGSNAETQLNNAAAARSQAYADLRSAEQQQQSQSISNYGIKTNSAGHPVTMVSGTKQNPGGIVVGQTGNSTINVAASTLTPSTRVKTDKGIVTAGSLPEGTQVMVAFNSAFTAPAKNGNAHSSNPEHSEHGTGNGANNAANTHSAHGLGGSESIGGGHSGGGYHY